jgi:tetratricopeptide (TPR) repeat protein/2-polyprenyl-3-methyl-5-hydroxy-6-metoxy-1,4-benzoquinol methylase
MRVSLCMIAKNEELNLPKCLGSVADLVDEIIVVDTGSTDRTREVAAGLGASVFDFTWVDDFAAARNESLRHATGDWIFWIDGDEWLDADNRQRLRALFAGLKDDNSAYVMEQRSVADPASGEASVFAQVRLFRNYPRFHWLYRVHEQILPTLEESGAVMRWTGIAIAHEGYEEPVLYRQKQERNLRLLKRQETERPDDPLTLFNLGLTYHVLGQITEAMRYWRRCLERASPGLSLVRKLYALMAKSHLQLGQKQEALAMCRTGLACYPDDVELLSLEAGLLSERGDLAGAEAALLHLLQAPRNDYFVAGVDVGLRSYRSRHNLATLYRAQNRLGEAEGQWQAALAEKPDYSPALLELGNLYLAQQRWPELDQVARQLENAPQGTLAAAQLRAKRYIAAQDFSAARRILEEAILRFPEVLDLHLLLSRLLLREGRDWAAVERELRSILAIDPYHTEACNNLTVFLRQQGRQPEALPDDIARELFNRAEKAYQTGNLQEATPLYRSLLHAGFQPGVMLHRLALVSNVQGDFGAAWELHLQALAVDAALAAKITPPEAPHHHIICRTSYALEEVPQCPVCGSTEQAAMMVVNCLPFNHYHPSIHPIRRWVRCQACGHGFANPRPTAAALQEAYQDPPPTHLMSWSYDRLTTWSDIVHELWLRHPGGDFLDVGTGAGGLAGVAMDYGYRACGLDVHPAYADHVRRLAVQFIQGDLATLDFGARQFDVIALGDVLEHLADPRAALAKVAALLKRSGLIWLSTPNYEGVWTRSLRDKDAMWMEGEHLQFFSLRSLTRLVNDQRMTIVDYRLSKRFVGCAEVILIKAGESS